MAVVRNKSVVNLFFWNPTFFLAKKRFFPQHGWRLFFFAGMRPGDDVWKCFSDKVKDGSKKSYYRKCKGCATSVVDSAPRAKAHADGCEELHKMSLWKVKSKAPIASLLAPSQDRVARSQNLQELYQVVGCSEGCEGQQATITRGNAVVHGSQLLIFLQC